MAALASSCFMHKPRLKMFVLLILSSVFVLALRATLTLRTEHVAANTRPFVMNYFSDTIASLWNSRTTKMCTNFQGSLPINRSFFPCNWRERIPPDCQRRLRATIDCSAESPQILYTNVPVSTGPAAYNFSDECLAQVVRERCSESKDRIPKLVHFVTFGGKKMTFYTFLGVLSAARFVQPCLLLFHADYLPTGGYWDTLVRMLPNIVHVKRQAPTKIFGREVKVVEHQSDIARLEAVKTFGGLYMDTDYLLLNPVEDLRHHTVVMGNTIPNYNYCNCIFMGRAGAQFFEIWHNSYRSFNDSVWAYHSTVMPYKIHHAHPDVPFHAVETFVRPWFKDIAVKFYKNASFDISQKHGIHLYVRLNKQYFKTDDFEVRNSSLGRVTRRVLYGDENSCF